jgi:hypothetical protein
LCVPENVGASQKFGNVCDILTASYRNAICYWIFTCSPHYIDHFSILVKGYMICVFRVKKPGIANLTNTCAFCPSPLLYRAGKKLI